MILHRQYLPSIMIRVQTMLLLTKTVLVVVIIHAYLLTEKMSLQISIKPITMLSSSTKKMNFYLQLNFSQEIHTFKMMKLEVLVIQLTILVMTMKSMKTVTPLTFCKTMKAVTFVKIVIAKMYSQMMIFMDCLLCQYKQMK